MDQHRTHVPRAQRQAAADRWQLGPQAALREAMYLQGTKYGGLGRVQTGRDLSDLRYVIQELEGDEDPSARCALPVQGCRSSSLH